MPQRKGFTQGFKKVQSPLALTPLIKAIKLRPIERIEVNYDENDRKWPFIFDDASRICTDFHNGSADGFGTFLLVFLPYRTG